MKKIVVFISLVMTSNFAFATTMYTCMSANSSNRLLTLTTLGSDLESPEAVILEGFISSSEFTLKKQQSNATSRNDLTRYVGKKKVKGFSKPVQQTIYLSKNWSENEGRLMYLVVGQENVAYESYVCSED